MHTDQIALFKHTMKEAGSLLLSFWSKPITVMKKGTSIVTHADGIVENYLIAALEKLLPGADFLAEESGFSGVQTNGYRWVIDPLDGTRNFARHIPYFSISVALTYHDEPVMGAIYDPLHDELFFAQKGKQATCNGSPIVVSKLVELDQSVIVTRVRTQDFVGKVASVRHMGSIALDMANLAAGRFDGMIFVGPSWWDIAAGLLIIRQAGGKVADLDGLAALRHGQMYVAAGEPLFDHLSQMLKD